MNPWSWLETQAGDRLHAVPRVWRTRKDQDLGRTDHQRFRTSRSGGRYANAGGGDSLCGGLCRDAAAGRYPHRPRQPPLGPNALAGRAGRAASRGTLDHRRRHRRHAHRRRPAATPRRRRCDSDHRQPQSRPLQRAEAVFRRWPRHSRRTGPRGLGTLSHGHTSLGAARSPRQHRALRRLGHRPSARRAGYGRCRTDSQAPVPRAAWTATTAPAASSAGGCSTSLAAA